MDISAARASRRRPSTRSRLARRVRFVDEEDMRVSAVRASRTAVQQTASAEDFLLTRQAVVGLDRPFGRSTKTQCGQKWKGKHSFI